MRLVLSTQEEFSFKRAHYGHSPLRQCLKIEIYAIFLLI